MGVLDVRRERRVAMVVFLCGVGDEDEDGVGGCFAGRTLICLPETLGIYERRREDRRRTSSINVMVRGRCGWWTRQNKDQLINRFYTTESERLPFCDCPISVPVVAVVRSVDRLTRVLFLCPVHVTVSRVHVM